MHTIQEKLLELSKNENLAQLSLRQMAEKIGMSKESPQKIKHHLSQLQKKGFLSIDRAKGMMQRSAPSSNWAKGFLQKTSRLFSIPIIGIANCGPATIFAEQNFQGFLRVSNKLLKQKKPVGLFAIKTSGASMNKAEIDGKKIDDGDYVIVDSGDMSISTGDIVLAIIDNKATIKQFIDDRINGQIVLQAKSTLDYEPIHLHPDDDFSINGKIVGIVKKPSEVI
jgi:SOS-response transcriptional repressor LexA